MQLTMDDEIVGILQRCWYTIKAHQAGTTACKRGYTSHAAWGQASPLLTHGVMGPGWRQCHMQWLVPA